MNQRLALQLEEMETITAPGDAAYVAGVAVGVGIGVGIIVALT
ncbi:daptide-type RiPP [Paenibacillus aurantiacus]|uniref:Daptide-type RiPP n=1 Tax=Paenibacillus aurantiacus TaxID=1936118 RepID=A0ABV5KIH0_9BACL